jgi:hypothetical protein
VAKVVKKKAQRQKGFNEGNIPFAKENYVIMGIGIAVIVAGYLTMLEGSIEGFLPLVVSPILLVVGYCLIVPLGILYKKPSANHNEASSNVKSEKQLR